jgi:hypothetical protein
VPIDATIHQLICGRNRKIIKHIESATNTAIYFPPPFASAYQYCPPHSVPREPAQIWITGEKPDWIRLAKMKLHEVLTTMRLMGKDLHIAPAKIDSILLGRMDKIRKIIDTNGVYIIFPPLGSNQGVVRLQYAEGMHPERAVHDLMSLVSRRLYISVESS